MNTYNLELQSTTTSETQVLPTLQLTDFTKLSLDLSGINETILPAFLKIDWGDGNSQIFDNDLLRFGNNTVNILKFSPLLTDTYSKTYYPSSTSLYKSLTAQVLVNYINNDTVWIIIPIEIRTNDYFESIYDLNLINTNILPQESNTKEHQFITGSGGFLIELRQD